MYAIKVRVVLASFADHGNCGLTFLVGPELTHVLRRGIYFVDAGTALSKESNAGVGTKWLTSPPRIATSLIIRELI